MRMLSTQGFSRMVHHFVRKHGGAHYLKHKRALLPIPVNVELGTFERVVESCHEEGLDLILDFENNRPHLSLN